MTEWKEIVVSEIIELIGLTGSCFESPNDTVHVTVGSNLFAQQKNANIEEK